MKTDYSPFIFSTRVIGFPMLFVLVLWFVFWVEISFGLDFNNFGVQPRTLQGLRGIFFSPFIHGSMKHLFNNSIPLFVLTAALFYFYRNVSWKILGYGLVLTGFLTWCIGRPANHIGASGIIYLLVAFLFFKGIFSKYYRLVALSLVVVFLYGGLLWYVTPIDPEISWEGHLSGLLTGVLFAFIFEEKTIKDRPKYAWQQEDYDESKDEFMKYFDAHGNFIEEISQETETSTKAENMQYQYFYKPNKKED